MNEEINHKKYFIEVCLGSACFARGNRNIPNIIKKFLKDHTFESITDFRGKKCLELCSRGPVLIINDVIYEEVNEFNVELILKKAYKDEFNLV
ncbi:MAG: NAD(P)H-dependent oxidoreductase subunit E [Hyphomicrobiales bacterium]